MFDHAITHLGVWIINEDGLTVENIRPIREIKYVTDSAKGYAIQAMKFARKGDWEDAIQAQMRALNNNQSVIHGIDDIRVSIPSIDARMRFVSMQRAFDAYIHTPHRHESLRRSLAILHDTTMASPGRHFFQTGTLIDPVQSRRTRTRLPPLGFDAAKLPGIRRLEFNILDDEAVHEWEGLPPDDDDDDDQPF
jgi:hypothetical protein